MVTETKPTDQSQPENEAACGRLDAIVMQAEEMVDSGETVYSGELFLLRKVFESASDFEKSENWPDFAKRYSAEETKKCLFEAIAAFKRYLSEFE